MPENALNLEKILEEGLSVINPLNIFDRDINLKLYKDPVKRTNSIDYAYISYPTGHVVCNVGKRKNNIVITVFKQTRDMAKGVVDLVTNNKKVTKFKM